MFLRLLFVFFALLGLDDEVNFDVLDHFLFWLLILVILLCCIFMVSTVLSVLAVLMRRVAMAMTVAVGLLMTMRSQRMPVRVLLLVLVRMARLLLGRGVVKQLGLDRLGLGLRFLRRIRSGSAIRGHGVRELSQNLLINAIITLRSIGNITRHRLFQELYHVLHFSGVR